MRGEGGGAPSRWGRARAAAAGRAGRIAAAARQKARRATDRADRATGRRASTGFRAASGARGWRNRVRAARDAIGRTASGRPWVNRGFAAATAGAAALWGGGRRLGGWWRKRCEDNLNRYAPEPERQDRVPEQDAPRGDGEPGPGGAPETPNGRPDPRPENTSPHGGPNRGGSMAGLPMAAVAADMNAAAARYAPDDMWEVVRESKEWPDVPRYVALSVRSYAQRLEGDYPINQAVTDKLHELYQALAGCASIAEEIEPLLRKAHEADIDRKENARRGEEKWNV